MTDTTTRDVIADFIQRCDVAASGGEPIDPFRMLDENVDYVRHGYEGSDAKCRNLAEVREKVLPPEVLANVLMRPGYGMYPIEYIEEGNRVVVLMKGRGDNTRCIPYNNTCFFLFEVRNGKIVRVLEDLDASLSRRCLYDMHLEEGERPH